MVSYQTLNAEPLSLFSENYYENLIKSAYLCSMKKIFSLFIILASTFFATLLAQRDSLYMFEINTLPKKQTVKVYLYTLDGKIDTHNPFKYFYGNSKTAMAKKDIPKEWRIKLKRNKQMNKYSYTFHYRQPKGLKSFANYSPDCNQYLFYTPLEGKNMYRIIKMVYEYDENRNGRLKNLKLIYENIGSGSIKIREHKQ